MTPTEYDENFKMYQYGVCDTGDGLELQKFDEGHRFLNDMEAAKELRIDVLRGVRYAHWTLLALATDYIERDGLGRDGQHHDMDLFRLWGLDTAPVVEA